MYRMSTTNDLVIRMRCGNGDTVGHKWGNEKGLRVDGALKKLRKSARGGIRVNVVCPAVIETAMGERLWGAPEAKKFALGLHPIGRFGTPMEIAEAVVWMCSDRASFMTGQSLVLDGGFLAVPNSPN